MRPTVSLQTYGLRRETPAVEQQLIGALAYSTVPTTVMGVAIAAVGAYSTKVSGDGNIGFVTVLAVISVGLKVWLVGRHWRHMLVPIDDLSNARAWQTWHAFLTFLMAGSTGMLCAAIFINGEINSSLLAVALVFAYCAGVVTRVSIRPGIAYIALLAAVLPSVTVILSSGAVERQLVGGLFLLFLLGSFESVRFLYDTARKQITQRIDMGSLARQDPLTGLSNRLGLREAFDEVVRKQRRYVAVHVFDLDGFKAVNDQHGHAAGDLVLVTIAKRLNALAREGEIVARLGGDEFVIVQHSLIGADTRGFVDRIIVAVREEIDLHGSVCTVGLSLGTAFSRSPSPDLDAMIVEADGAAYAAKKSGGSWIDRRHDGRPFNEAMAV